MYLKLIYILVVLATSLQGLSVSTKTSRLPSSSELVANLQTCFTPQQVIDQVGSRLEPSVDPGGNVASLILIRLSKQLIALDNEQAGNPPQNYFESQDANKNVLEQVISCLAEANGNIDSLVEGTKACAVLLRLLAPEFSVDPIVDRWRTSNCKLGQSLDPHQLSGLKWAFDTFSFVKERNGGGDGMFPQYLQEAYDALGLPFAILPGCFSNETELSVENLASQVAFRVDDIRTTSNKVVKERRKTAWEGDESVGPFFYAAKSMPRLSWSPIVRDIRDKLLKRTEQYYDGCLLNLYPDGRSGMRYHIDPDQGTLWDFDTAVVSVGATRRFSFRSIPSEENTQCQEKPHSFVVLHGDVAHMYGECQAKFQHSIKKADFKKKNLPERA